MSGWDWQSPADRRGDSLREVTRVTDRSAELERLEDDRQTAWSRGVPMNEIQRLDERIASLRSALGLGWR